LNDAEQQPALEILYQDEWLVAVNKPAGMLVHRSFLDKHETEFVMLRLRDQIGQHVFPLHRLDRPTSGVLLFGLSSDIARQMGEQQHQWQKTYLAVVRGYLKEAMLLDYALKEQHDAIADKFARTDKAAQQAQTAIWPLAQTELPFAVGRYPTARYSLLALQPLTGRKHQLRRHCEHLFHPIIGDTTHGDGKHNQLFRDKFHCNRLLLHAFTLAFQHPISGCQINIKAPLCDFAWMLSQLEMSVTEASITTKLASLDWTALPVRSD
jgi:tRNA pseudouridine65 synthase